MTGRPPDGGPGLGDRLRQEADRHHPDSDRIRARLDRPAASRVSVLLRRGFPAAISAAAATLVLVAGTSLLAVRAGDRAAPPAGAPGPVLTSTAAPRLPVPDPAGPLSEPDRTGARTPPTRATGQRTPAAGTPTPPPGTAPPADPVVDLQLRQVPVGTPVTLGPAGPGADWVLPGVAAAPVGLPSSTALAAPVVRGGRTGVPGPYRVSWTGGAPDPTGTAAPGWLAVDPTGSVTVTVPAAPGRRRLLLYVGTSGADVTAEVHLGAERRTVTLSAPAPAGIVTVTAESATEPLVVDLTGVARSGGGRFGLAAAVLTPS